MCSCVPITNKTRFVDNITVTNPDTCLPLNHIQLRQSNKHVHSAITSNQGNDTEDERSQLSQINILNKKQKGTSSKMDLILASDMIKQCHCTV